jgi:leucyl aminopeptidase (aminopeptidase T)
VLARSLRFRGATLPGFTEAMVPALRLDFGEVSRRVAVLAALLDRAEGAEAEFVVDRTREYRLSLDLRHRTAHVSGGLFPEPGTVGNLPSGEAYIVPYEGEVPGDPSGTGGELPVQFEDGLVVYRVEGNRAVQARGEDPAASREAALLAADPAYGNLAELGLGVLADFGIRPLGEVLVDEKLGLHVAFGRSDHFGGQVGPAQFRSPESVVHIDRVYVPVLQPRVTVARVDLRMPGGERLPLMRDGLYAVDFASR